MSDWKRVFFGVAAAASVLSGAVVVTTLAGIDWLYAVVTALVFALVTIQWAFYAATGKKLVTL